MKNFLLLSILFLFFGRCNWVKSPEYKGIEKIAYQVNNNKFNIIAYAKFHNPNLLSGKFKIENIKVWGNEKLLGTLNSEVYKVPAKKDFVIPLKIEFNKNFFAERNHVLNTLNSLIQNRLKVRYYGKIFYVSHKLKIPYQIDYTQDIKIFKDK